MLNGSESLYLDRVVRILTAAQTWIPLYLSLFYVVVKNNDTVKKILLILASAALCVLIAGTVDDEIVKPLVGRFRPSHDPQIGLLVDIVDSYRGGRFGFFSAHASNTFAIAVFFSLLMRSRLLTTALFTWSFVNCWTRMYLAVHFPGDIVCGLLWGALTGLVVYYLFFLRLYRRISRTTTIISSRYTSSGYERNDINIILTTLVGTLLYALIRATIW